MNDSALYRYYARLSGAVFLKLALAVVGVFLGRYLDRRWGTEPYLLMTCFTLGVSLGLWWVVRVASADKS